VIELAANAVFDVNGWDLAKALRLLIKGNAVVIDGCACIPASRSRPCISPL
jgi:predicted nucleotidyltransferase